MNLYLTAILTATLATNAARQATAADAQQHSAVRTQTDAVARSEMRLRVRNLMGFESLLAPPDMLECPMSADTEVGP